MGIDNGFEPPGLIRQQIDCCEQCRWSRVDQCGCVCCHNPACYAPDANVDLSYDGPPLPDIDEEPKDWVQGAAMVRSEDVCDLFERAIPTGVYNEPSEPWLQNSIQFPRLICELLATQDLDRAALRDSMDLNTEEVSELFERAHKAWERAKKESQLPWYQEDMHETIEEKFDEDHVQ